MSEFFVELTPEAGQDASKITSLLGQQKLDFYEQGNKVCVVCSAGKMGDLARSLSGLARVDSRGHARETVLEMLPSQAKAEGTTNVYAKLVQKGVMPEEILGSKILGKSEQDERKVRVKVWYR